VVKNASLVLILCISPVLSFKLISLIRISGIPEPTEEGDTTEKVRKIISDIDPSYEITNIIRSHRVGKPDEKAAAVVKHRQIIVRLSDPGVKFRILKYKLSSFYLFSQFRSSPASQKMDRSVWPWSRRRLWC
jgi:hypothetical protein